MVSSVGLVAPLLNPTLPPGTQFAVLDTTEANIEKYTQEVRLASPTGGALEWQVGGFFAHESSALPQCLPSLILPTLAPSGLPPVVTAATNALYREWAAFGQITYHFSPAFDVALGGRWSENKQSVNTADNGLLFLLGGIPPETSTGASTGTDFLYSVAPRWHLSQNTMAYARVATAIVRADRTRRPRGPPKASSSFTSQTPLSTTKSESSPTSSTTGCRSM